MNDTAKLLAIVILASFATERVLAATSYVLDAMRIAARNPRLAERLRRRQWKKLLLLGIAAAIAAVVVARADVRVLKLLGLKASDVIDYGLSWLIVLGGADKLRAIIGGPASPAPQSAGVKVVVDGQGQVTKLLKAS